MGAAGGATELRSTAHPELLIGSVSNETGGEPPDLYSLNPNDDADWRAMQRRFFAPLREHVWRGHTPPGWVPEWQARVGDTATWNEARELTYVRNWLRRRLLDPDEVVDFLKECRRLLRWGLEPGSLAELGRAHDGQAAKVEEIVGAMRKRIPQKKTGISREDAIRAITG